MVTSGGSRPRIAGYRRPGRLLGALLLVAGQAQAQKAAPDYGRDVRPILSENCFQCHGQDGKKRMAGLRLDSFEGATAIATVA